MKKVYIKTFGCQMNEYDTDKIHDVLREQSGFSKTDDINEADVVLLNENLSLDELTQKVRQAVARFGLS